MDKLIERCAGLDVHKKTVAACVRVPGSDGERRQETRTFSTMTDGLLALRDWLCAHGVRVVGMESTGVYWKPVVRHEAPLNRVEVGDLHHLAVAAAG
jgi:transposase